MIRYASALLLIAFCVAPARAQGRPPNPCDTLATSAVLEGSAVRAGVSNNGFLVFDGARSLYEVPKGTGTHAFFNISLWVAGLTDGDLRVTATTAGPQPYAPGPLRSDGTASDCVAYNRIYTVDRADLNGADTSRAVAAWPAGLGAPYVDRDGAPGYDPGEGDRPALRGDHTAWWVMNDVAPSRDGERPHFNGYGPVQDTPPLGLEVRATAHAFDDPRPAWGTTTFYEYELHYRGAAPLDSAFVGLFVDPDLGNFSDDHFGVDTTLGLAFAYNADGDDEGQYGSPPPAAGVALLEGPVAATPGGPQLPGLTGLTNVFKGNQPYGEPSAALGYWRALRGFYRNGDPMIAYGDGLAEPGMPDSIGTTRFAFPGDPVTGRFWSKENAYGDGRAIAPYDVRFLMVSGPFAMAPGEVRRLRFAIVWARGADRLNSVTELRQHVRALHAVGAEALFRPQVPNDLSVAPPAPTLAFEVFPNPAGAEATVRWRLPKRLDAEVAIYDGLGRRVAVLAAGPQEAGAHTAPIDVGGLTPGAYFVRLRLPDGAFTKPLIVVR